MKILLTGATGFIGGEILQQAIAHIYISHIVVLTRRPLDDKLAQHKKVTEIVHDDFEEWPESLLARLKDAGVEACIWALGGKVEQFKNLDEARKVGINYPILAAEAIAKTLAPALVPYNGYPAKRGPDVGEDAFPFRFVFISGWGAEQDQFRSLWMFSDSRKIKGAAEKGLFETAEKCEEVDGHKCFEVIAMRPGGVLSKGETLGNVISAAVMASCTVDRLATSAIRAILNGTGGKKILENRDCLGEDWALVNSTKYLD